MQRDLTWTTLASSYLLKDTWATIRTDTCLLPNGKVIDPIYVYEFPDWVTAFAITKDGKVLLERQYRHALGRTDIESLGGCMDHSDASSEAALQRELLEETCYRFTEIQKLGITSANPSTNNNIMHMFLATGGEKVAEQNFDPGEDLEILLASFDEVKQFVRENKIIHSMHVTCILLAWEKLGELHF
jgi:8-oxo-dGTP pyrophosphatase MutT (NUDIX family)